VVEISAVVLTRDEESNIAECLASLRWAEKILVLDSWSEDATVEIARREGAEVRQRAFDNYAGQRNAALALATTEWVFFVDADERVPQELADEVRWVVNDDKLDGWWVPRKNFIFGRWVRHAGWYPDYQLRVLRRVKAHYDERREVHELVILDGEAGYLESPLIHYNYDTVGQFRAKQERYTDYEAQMLYQEGVRAKPWNFVLQPLRQFRWRYFTLRGYRDGWPGLLLSSLMAYYEMVRYWRLWHLQRV
jgi:(heptosyl)LPS beta-1,4-glucosyltransferase